MKEISKQNSAQIIVWPLPMALTQIFCGRKQKDMEFREEWRISRYKIMTKEGTDRASEIVKETNSTPRTLALVKCKLTERKEPEPTLSELKMFPVHNNY